MEYDFDVEHIPGKENILADAFSRLITIPNTQQQTLASLNVIVDSNLIPHEQYKLISSVHNTYMGLHGL